MEEWKEKQREGIRKEVVSYPNLAVGKGRKTEKIKKRRITRRKESIRPVNISNNGKEKRNRWKKT